MAMAGSPIKHERNRIVQAAILSAMETGQTPEQFVKPYTDVLRAKALEGDMAAMKELFDRLDGKPAQQVQLSGDADGAPIRHRIEQVIVDPNAETP